MGSPLPHLHGGWAHPATSALGLGSPPATSAPGLGLTSATSAPGLRLTPARYDLTPWEILEITKVRAASIKQTAKIFGIPSERSLTTATLHA